MSLGVAVAPAFVETPQVEPEFELQLCMGEALVVDDSPDITELLAAVLRREPFDEPSHTAVPQQQQSHRLELFLP